ncbi:MAG TPA: bifunctional DNA primase/polymerase [Pyrinomonadaceae bacterium]|nr:bifunctional DNA primase/polymerase [Pyrinomonadaceae bacterium]
MDRLNLIEKYLEAGLMVTPLIEGGKKPPKGWTKLKLRNKTKNELLNYFVQNPQANVGCWMPENFVVVDADDLDEFYRLTGGEVWETLTATSGREEGGLHYWFRHSGNVGSGTGIRPDLDFKSSRSLVVLPPSVHKSGAEYRWQNLVAPIDAPELIQDFYDTRQNLKKQNLKSLPVLPIARRGASVFINADTVLGEKQRYDHLFPIGRRLRFRLNAEEVIAELHRLNGLHCQPPLNEERMRKLVKDVLHGRDRRDFRRN